MPHLSPMSWLLAIITTWIIMMLFTSNIWWIGQHMFETKSMKTNGKTYSSPWHWFLQDGWEK
uniref:ATPase 8 n=1 Tax=Terrisswalkerius canaliculatus TaxID=169913 RepID=Q94VQ5_9ANNE|nr:ATPase 8 [Terrisswalkerius canaliculatus]